MVRQRVTEINTWKHVNFVNSSRNLYCHGRGLIFLGLYNKSTSTRHLYLSSIFVIYICYLYLSSAFVISICHLHYPKQCNSGGSSAFNSIQSQNSGCGRQRRLKQRTEPWNTFKNCAKIVGYNFCRRFRCRHHPFDDVGLNIAVTSADTEPARGSLSPPFNGCPTSKTDCQDTAKFFTICDVRCCRYVPVKPPDLLLDESANIAPQTPQRTFRIMVPFSLTPTS
ncbi:hypothetical protein V1520DRAFT_187615 [Lipomyces starkeyi]